MIKPIPRIVGQRFDLSGGIRVLVHVTGEIVMPGFASDGLCRVNRIGGARLAVHRVVIEEVGRGFGIGHLPHITCQIALVVRVLVGEAISVDDLAHRIVFHPVIEKVGSRFLR